jgi:CBS domain-containing protein
MGNAPDWFETGVTGHVPAPISGQRQRVEVVLPRARAFMNQHVLTFSPSDDIGEAVRMLLRKGYSGAPVVDADGKVVGVLSEADCMTVLSEAAYGGWPSGTVENHMQTELDAIGPDTDLFAAKARFSGARHRRLPVVADDGKLVGLITRRDVLRALDQFREMQEQARHASTYELIERRR